MAPRQVGIIGAGNVGTALARGLATAGFDVRAGVRDPDSETGRARAAELGDVPLLTIADAVDGADVVMLAVPSAAIASAMAGLTLAGTVVVDATNAVREPPPDEYPTVGAYVAALLPDAYVVKAFNTIGAEHLGDGRFGEQRAVLPIAGADEGRPVVAAMGEALGFEVADLGGPEAVPLVEDFARLWIHLAFRCGWGRRFGFAVVRD